MKKVKSPLTKRQRVYLFFKRIIDIVGSIIGILVCIPLLWWWVLIVNLFVTKGHPFFRQERIGRHKKVFKIIKFRSMRIDSPEIAPSEMTKETQASMYTKFGKFLRASSIDETPQLLNVLGGSMSFIGPRPGAAHNEEQLIIEREKYSPNAFDVKPGIGGYAQTRMKRSHDPIEKAKQDAIYVKRFNFWLDVEIFVYTLLMAFGLAKGR